MGGVANLDCRANILDEATRLQSEGRHIAPVLWRGQPAWLKLAVPQFPNWRYLLLGYSARLLGLSAMQPVRPPGGIRGLQIELERINSLSEAGLHTPVIYHSAENWLLMSDIGPVTLEIMLRNAVSENRLACWKLGADYIRKTHANGQYLSQAFTRNFVWSDEMGLGAIDFEDDAISVMSLSDAQARDWLLYMFSTAVYFEDRLPILHTAIIDVTADECDEVKESLFSSLRRTAWLRLLRWLPHGMKRRDVTRVLCYGNLASTFTRRLNMFLAFYSSNFLEMLDYVLVV